MSSYSNETAVDTGASYDGPAAGCTAVVAVVVGKDLYVANAGDSRCVLCHGELTRSLTRDHKPTNPEEEKRINEAGGFVTEGRVNGCLNLSRAIGDMNYKQVCTLRFLPVHGGADVWKELVLGGESVGAVVYAKHTGYIQVC